MEQSKDFLKWKERYAMRWCTVPQLQRLVKLERITQEELEIIVDEKESN
ncbi:TPA: XkdX family protein [Bacillus pseudomycoides]|nr:XkdX family protein [Bacillus pseudomycoides]